MIRSTAGAGRFLLLGAVRGLESEATALVVELDQFRPAAVGLGVSFDELTGLRDHFVGAATEPVVPLTGNEVAEVRGLSRFGDVRVPNPVVLAALEWADRNHCPAEALDLNDDHYATMFADHISYLELVRRTVRERRLTRDPPAAATADEFATTWHRRIAKGRGSRSFDAAREAALVEAATDLGRRVPKVAVVVDRERYPAVLVALGGAGAP